MFRKSDLEMAEKRDVAKIIYKCVQCGSEITSEQLSIMLGINCPNCGYRTLKKTRSQVVTKVKAR